MVTVWSGRFVVMREIEWDSPWLSIESGGGGDVRDVAKRRETGHFYLPS